MKLIATVLMLDVALLVGAALLQRQEMPTAYDLWSIPKDERTQAVELWCDSNVIPYHRTVENEEFRYVHHVAMCKEV